MKAIVCATYIMSTLIIAQTLSAKQEPGSNDVTNHGKQSEAAQIRSRKSKATPKSTIIQVLGAEAVKTVVRDAISEAAEEVSSTYVLTTASFDRLKERGTSEAALANLRTMAGERIGGREKFEAVVTDRVEASVRNDLEQIARTKLIATDEFLKRVEALVLESPLPQHSDPKTWVEKHFKRFLAGYIAYVEASSKNQNEIVLKTDRLNEYLKAAKCGELSCPGTPPCCGDECDPCKGP